MSKQMFWLFITLFVVFIVPTDMGGGGRRAFADTNSVNMHVTSEVVSNCVFNGGSGGDDISFGAYNSLGENESTGLSTNTYMQIRCSKGSSVTITISNGQNAIGAQRQMSNGYGDYLAYDLYQDAGYSTEWGNTEGSGYSFISTSASVRSPTVYARIPPGQDTAPAGVYTDSVVITATF